MKTPLYDEDWAANYDALAEAGIAGRAGIYRLCVACLAELGVEAEVLVVGAGVGTEVLELATHFPSWRFTAVEPAAPMLDVARTRVREAGFAERVRFVNGFVSQLPNTVQFVGATAILVSQHCEPMEARRKFFKDIAVRLNPGAPLFHAELCGETEDEEWPQRAQIWERQAVFAGCPPEAAREMLARLGEDVALISSVELEALMPSVGFSRPLALFRSLHYGAFLSRRNPSLP